MMPQAEKLARRLRELATERRQLEKRLHELSEISGSGTERAALKRLREERQATRDELSLTVAAIQLVEEELLPHAEEEERKRA